MSYDLIMGIIGFFGLILIGIGAFLFGNYFNSGSGADTGWYLIGIGVIIVSLEKLIGIFIPKK